MRNIDPNAKVGMRIRLTKDMDDQQPILKGQEGTINNIDDIGTLHVLWDDKRLLGVIPNVDSYELLPPESEQVDFSVFESTEGKLTKNFTREAKKAFSSVKPNPGIKIESDSKENPKKTIFKQDLDKIMNTISTVKFMQVQIVEKMIENFYEKYKDSVSDGKKLEKIIDNLKEKLSKKFPIDEMDAVGSNGLAGAAGYSYSAPLKEVNTTKNTDLTTGSDRGYDKGTWSTKADGWDWNDEALWEGGEIVDLLTKVRNVWDDSDLDISKQWDKAQKIKEKENELTESKKNGKKKIEEEDVNEDTTFGSVFGSGFPVGPAFAAKKGQWRSAKKPIWKGGTIIQKEEDSNEGTLRPIDEVNKVKFVKGSKYVKVKDKCAKYNNQPWCNQGAIDKPLELSNQTFESIKKVSKKTGVPFNVILENINKKLLEDFGRNYTIQSLYDVIQDELLNDPKIEQWKTLMDSPIGGVENFEMPHHQRDYGNTEGMSYDEDDVLGIKGPHGMLAMVILPKLVKMGILTGDIKDQNELGILNTISELLYQDIKPEGFNDVKHTENGDYDLTENTIKNINNLSKKLGISKSEIVDRIKFKFKSIN